eukprot:augustus_masked-scaffold_3-processed-gene-11.43-mRNA-1 protein AED:1.00 eAED:1.00 QI:0/0/0/0/1/1/4/0/1016
MDLLVFNIIYKEKNLQRSINSYDSPIIFNTEDDPDEYEAEEIGYCENAEKDDANEEQKIKSKIEKKVEELRDKYIDKEVMQFKEILINKFRAFGDKESPARMSKLDPILWNVIPNAVFSIDTPRNSGPTMLGYLRTKLESMEARGLIKRSRNPKHGCQTFLVPKKGPEKYRMVTNMKPLNKVTIKTPLTIPNLEQQVFVLMGSSFYGTFDILSGFDYMPVHKNSTHFSTIVTPIEAYEMIGSPMGWINTPMLFQERMQTEVLGDKFIKKKDDAICWINDIVVYSTTFQNYLVNLSQFLDRFISLNLRLNIDKCFSLKKEVEWCGRKISKENWNFSEKYFNKIMDMKRPYFCHQLAQALHLANWLSPVVEHLAEYRDYFAKLVDLKKPKAQLKKENKARIVWLLFGQEATITVFMDHKNLQYVLTPENSPRQTQVGRMYRWSYQFQQFDMIVRHIPGEENVAADILSRWGNRYCDEKVSDGKPEDDVIMFLDNMSTYGARIEASGDEETQEVYDENRISFLSPWHKNKFKRPSDEELLEIQRQHMEGTVQDLIMKEDKIWIPWDANFICRLIISNHISQNHVSTKQEEDMLRDSKEIIHADFLLINSSYKIIVLVDNVTQKVFLKGVEKEDASNMALALIEFLANFQLNDNFTLVTDNAAYFAGKLLHTLSEIYHFKRYFSIKFSPWTNGVVEVTNAKIVRIIRTLCSKFRLNSSEIHKLIGTIMDSLNNYPSKTKAGYKQNELFMQAPPITSNTLLENWLEYDELRWEPWQTMCEDLSNFSEDVVKDYTGKYKKASRSMWIKINGKDVDTVRNTGTSGQAVPTTVPGWFPEEKEILHCAVMKYGFGNHKIIRKLNLLPGKNTQKIHNQLQKLVFKQAASEYHNIFVDLYKIARKNRDVFNSFHIRDNNMGIEELSLRRALNQLRFGFSPMERHKVVVPFFRRLDNIENYIDYFTFNDYYNPGDIIPVLNEPTIERKTLEEELMSLIKERKIKNKILQICRGARIRSGRGFKGFLHE